MARNTNLLRELTGAWGGAGFWTLLEGDRLICLNTVVADDSADPGFRAGDAKPVQETGIPSSLLRREAEFVTEPDGSRKTMLVPITSRRGHDFGWIGLTLPGNETPPPAASVQQRIASLASNL